MNWLKLSLWSCLCCGSTTAQTLFTYGKYPVSAREFKTAFEKNPSTENRKKAMEEYLPLFINYKLKVQDAYDKKMDTLPQQVDEYQNYRSQLEESYLTQLSNTDVLVKEAFERSQKDILLGHLFIGFKPGDTAAEKNAANKARQAYQQLQAGTPFAEAIKQYGTDAEAIANGGEVGWVTAFTLPYNYESALYKTPVGKTTAPIKGSDGYHIFQNRQERAAVGRVQVAQILLWVSSGASPAEEAKTKKLADSLYDALKKGAAFDALAVQFSNDRSSYASGGVLQEFGVASYDATFEKQAFSLNTKGDISQPFRSPYGWHIIKLIDKKPVAKSQEDAEALAAIKQQVMADNRAQHARENFIRQQMKKMNYRQGKFSFTDLWRFTDSMRRNAAITGIPVQKNTLLFAMGNEKVLAENWALYERAVKGGAAIPPTEYEELWNKYVLQTAEANYRAQLEVYDPVFKAQLKEFKDANLLFENMDKQVWTAAAEDTTGLRNYYTSHRSKYVWLEGAAALIVTSNDSATIDAYRKALVADPKQWMKLADKYKERLIADSSRFELNQLPGSPTAMLQAGATTPLLHNALDNSYSFAYIFKPLPAGDLRTLDEARGWVITDYQQVLETRWLKKLSARYPVKMNDAVWKQVLAGK